MAKPDLGRDESPFGPVFDGAYAPIGFGGAPFGFLSVAFFAASLFARYLVGALAPDGMSFFRRAFVTALAVPILSGIGLLLGLLGSRLGRGRGLAKAGAWLNLVVVVLSLLALAAFYRIMPDNWQPLPIRRQ